MGTTRLGVFYDSVMKDIKTWLSPMNTPLNSCISPLDSGILLRILGDSNLLLKFTKVRSTNSHSSYWTWITPDVPLVSCKILTRTSARLVWFSCMDRLPGLFCQKYSISRDKRTNYCRRTSQVIVNLCTNTDDIISHVIKLSNSISQLTLPITNQVRVHSR